MSVNSPRWRKLVRDVAVARGRVALMVGAIALSLFAVGAVLGAFAILTREVPRSYLSSRPATAALELAPGEGGHGELDAALLDEVRRQPGIAAAEQGDIVLARAKVGDDWIPLLLFVVDDFAAQQLNVFKHESGAWPPPVGTMLIERSAQAVLAATTGGEVLVKTPHGKAQPVRVSGLVHDTGLAPAWQEREGYGYLTRATLATLGEPSELDELRIEVTTPGAIEARVNELARFLVAHGHPVTRARVPPPGRHPHQTQMMGVLFLLVTFSGMALVLSGVLVATSLGAMLARQVREIGVMKTVGATASQVAGMYFVLVTALALAAEAIALPAAVAGARGLAGMSAGMLNVSLIDQSLPWWVFAVQAAAGILVPWALAAVPITRGSRITVRDALDQHGVAQSPRRAGWLTRRLSTWSPLTALAARNTFRRRGRFLLTTLLLAAGGAMFMTALGVARGWEHIVDRIYENRRYDVEVRLNAPAAIATSVREVDGVRAVEAWGYAATAFWHPERTDIVRTYPDGSHGSLALMGLPPSTDLVHFPLLAGRWLAPGDTDAVVLNHMALAQTEGARVGDTIVLSVAGKPTRWRLVGVVEEVGAAGVAYVTDTAFSEAAALPAGTTRMVRVSTEASSPTRRTEIIRALEAQLAREDVSVAIVIPLAMLRTAMGDHVLVLVRLLLAIAALMVIVGLLGLGATMGTNVVERTRELGVMKTLGATPRATARAVLTEAMLVGMSSWLGALALAVPLTFAVGRTVGQLAFRVRLPFALVPEAVLGWAAMVLVLAAVATLVPARRASRLTVVEALGRV